MLCFISGCQRYGLQAGSGSWSPLIWPLVHLLGFPCQTGLTCGTHSSQLRTWTTCCICSGQSRMRAMCSAHPGLAGVCSTILDRSEQEGWGRVRESPACQIYCLFRLTQPLLQLVWDLRCMWLESLTSWSQLFMPTGQEEFDTSVLYCYR